MGRWNWWLPSWLDRVVPHTVHGATPHPAATADPAA